MSDHIICQDIYVLRATFVGLKNAFFQDSTSSGSMSLNSMPLPVQEIAPVLVGSSSRVTRNCHSWRDPRLVGPGKILVVGLWNMRQELKQVLNLEIQEVQAGLQVHLAPNLCPADMICIWGFTKLVGPTLIKYILLKSIIHLTASTGARVVVETSPWTKCKKST